MIRTAGARATVTVDLAAVAANIGRLREAAAPAEVWAVVKADGYGHGATAVGRTAITAGAERLCVATWDEARDLRDELGDVPVLVMGRLQFQARRARSRASTLPSRPSRVSPACGPPHARRSASTSRPTPGWGGGAWLRTTRCALGEQLADGDVLGLGGLMSHLASADADEAFTRSQIERFGELAARFPPCPRHIANSAAVLRFPEARFDAVRCGIAVYGLSPFGADPADDGLAPAIRLESFVAEVKVLAAGDSAGYGRRLVASEADCGSALVPAGYADGVPRILSGRADVLVRGRRRRVAATVSMDQLTFVIGAECDVEPGDAVTLIGEDGGERILAEEWARLAGTINYEIVTSLAPRPRRVEHVLRGA